MNPVFVLLALLDIAPDQVSHTCKPSNAGSRTFMDICVRYDLVAAVLYLIASQAIPDGADCLLVLFAKASSNSYAL